MMNLIPHLPNMLQRHLLITQAAIIILSSLASKGFSAAIDYRYEACSVPKSCGSGPNVSYPFYISGLQESYCGHPGFSLDCDGASGLPILNLTGNDYMVENIYYSNSSIRVYEEFVTAYSTYDDYWCSSALENTTIPTSPFAYAAAGNKYITQLHLFSNCSDLSEKIDPSSYIVQCKMGKTFYSSRSCSYASLCRRGGGPYDMWIVAMYDKDENLKEAQDKCNISVVKPVEHSEKFSGNYNATASLAETLRSGIELSWAIASDCKPCKASGGYCGFDPESDSSFTCFCEDGPHATSCEPIKGSATTVGVAKPPAVVADPPAESEAVNHGSGGGKLRRMRNINEIVIISLCVVSSFIALFGFLYVIGKKSKRRRLARNNRNMELFLKNHGDVAPKRYKYSQLKKMTHKFKDNLGKGGYGSVYKGTLDDGRLVAVKILDQTKGNGDEFLNEVACISRTSHVNIVTLLGFCLEGSRRALVYEYMPNGSLDKFIQDSSSLNWEKLCDIALGVARGLEYLHQGCSTRILHFDIKPHNVLLDKDLRPKISDFGLAKLCPERVSIVSMSGTRGTIGYIAPELFSRFFGTISYKSDVYSYGMMVLEMVGERVNNNGRRRERNDCTSSSDMYFPHWIYKNLEVNFNDDEIDDDEWRLVKRKLTIVGLWCIQNDSKDRPSMTKVVEMLEGDVELLQIPPKPCLSSTTRELQGNNNVSVSASGIVTSDFE